MRRRDGGIGCGDRGQVTQTCTREAPGPDRGGITTPPRGARWTGTVPPVSDGPRCDKPMRRTGTKALRRNRDGNQETRTWGSEIAAVECREAPASFKRGCGKTEDWCATRCSIPSMWSGDRKGPAQAGKGYGVPGAAKNTGGGAWLFDRWIGEQARHTLCCRPRAGGDPVNTASAVITGSPAGACHRAGLWPDPLAGDDNRSKRVRPAVARTAPFQQKWVSPSHTSVPLIALRDGKPAKASRRWD